VCRRVQLLALPPTESWTAAALSRSDLYTAAVLQHAALLLLLLVSDSTVLVLPTEAVPPSLLQLLHLLTSVHQALLQQLQQQPMPEPASEHKGPSIAQLLSSRQQPVQLHVALQVRAPWNVLLTLCPFVLLTLHSTSWAGQHLQGCLRVGLNWCRKVIFAVKSCAPAPSQHTCFNSSAHRAETIHVCL